MALQSVWYETQIPPELVDILERDAIQHFENQMGDSRLYGDALNRDRSR